MDKSLSGVVELSQSSMEKGVVIYFDETIISKEEVVLKEKGDKVGSLLHDNEGNIKRNGFCIF